MDTFISFLIFFLVLFCGLILFLMPRWKWFIVCATLYICSSGYLIYNIANIPPEQDHGGGPLVLSVIYFLWIIVSVFLAAFIKAIRKSPPL